MDKLEVISYDKVGLTGESLSVQLSLEHFTYSLPGVFLSYTLPSTPSFFSSNFQSLAYLTSTRRHLENTLKRKNECHFPGFRNSTHKTSLCYCFQKPGYSVRLDKKHSLEILKCVHISQKVENDLNKARRGSTCL